MLPSAEQAALSAAVRRLDADRAELVAGIVERLVVDESHYARSSQLPAEQLRTVVADNFAAILAQLADGTGDPEVARATGRLKAEHGIPVAALLHAYRMSGLLVWENLVARAESEPQLREALPGLASRMWRAVDEFSEEAAAAHGEATAEQVHHGAKARERLLSALLTGTAEDSERLWDLLRAFRLPSSGAFVVVSAETPPHGGDPLPRVEEHLGAQGFNSVWAREVEAAVGLVSVGALGEQRLLRALGELARSRVGVSATFGNPLDAPGALREAQLAHRCLPPDEAAVTRYDERPLPLLVAKLPVASREMVDQLLGPVLRLPRAERDTVLATLDAWYDSGGSTPRAAASLHCHRNTVLHRLRRIEQLTGLAVADPAQGAQLYLALRAARIVGFPEQHTERADQH